MVIQCGYNNQFANITMFYRQSPNYIMMLPDVEDWSKKLNWTN